MNTLSSSISESAHRFVEDQLSNNEVSSDDELLGHFIENGLTEAQALTYRDLYLSHIYLDGFTPICMGTQALRYTPHSRQSEPV